MQRVLEAKGHLLKKSTESERDEGAAQADKKVLNMSAAAL